MSFGTETNPRLSMLRSDVEKVVLEPFRLRGWTADVSHEHNLHSSLEIIASKKDRNVRIAVLYSASTSTQHYKELAQNAEFIFYHGMASVPDGIVSAIGIPVESLSDFLPILISLNKEFEPDRTPLVPTLPPVAIRRITEENPLGGILNRLQQFTSVNLAARLVLRRAEHEGVELYSKQVNEKATGVAFAMQNALDYISFGPSEKLNKRILGLYYGSVAFAFAEMLAAPSGPSSLDEVEQMTKFGHGLYTYASADAGFADTHVGVLATGFLPQWLSFLGHDVSRFPKRKPRTEEDLSAIPENMRTTLEFLFSSMPEIDDLFSEVFGAAPGWIIPVYDMARSRAQLFPPAQKKRIVRMLNLLTVLD